MLLDKVGKFRWTIGKDKMAGETRGGNNMQKR